jgi:6-phosphogluconolactonase
MCRVTVAPEIRIFETLDEAAREAAELFAWLAGQAAAKSARFRVALSGGTTPQALYSLLAGPPFADQAPWPQVDFYFGDERCVPPDHPESNYRMANLSLLRPLRIPADQVFRMAGELPDPGQAARDYEAQIRRSFNAGASGLPQFDLILLGIGDDGHTASLFPNTKALDEKERLVVDNQATRGIARRLTFTVPLINAARLVLFLVCGAGKASAVRAVLEGSAQPSRLPAQLIRPRDGRLLWFLDRAAAAELAVSRKQVVSHEE